MGKLALGAAVVFAAYLVFKGLQQASGATVPIATTVPPPATTTPVTIGSFVPKTSSPQVAFFGTLANIATHPTQFQEAIGLEPATFQTFGDQDDFARLMSNTHSCQTGNQAACEAVWEQSPDMQCDPSFCDQDPNTNNGHGSAVDLGNGQFRYNYRGNVGLIGHYGKKVPVGGCRVTGRKYDVNGGANAQSNIDGGYCAGIV